MFDEKKLQEIKEHCSKWEDGVLRKTLDSVPESCEEFRTLSGIPVQRLYLPQQKDYMQDLGFPGEYPYIRGGACNGLSWSYVDDAPVRRIRNGRGHEPAL